MRELSSSDLQRVSGGLDIAGAALYALTLYGSKIGYASTVNSKQEQNAHTSGTIYGVMGATMLGGLLTYPFRHEQVTDVNSGLFLGAGLNLGVGFLCGIAAATLEDPVSAYISQIMQRD